MDKTTSQPTKAQPAKAQPITPRPNKAKVATGKVATERVVFPLNKINFILMGIAAAMIVLGFLLMCGSSSSIEEFNPDIFSTRRIVVGPTIAFLGFIFMAFGIIYRTKKEDNNNNKE